MRRLFVLLLLGSALAGCGSIAVEPEPLPPPPPAKADYDLAVFSVDFDPALQGNRLPVSSSYAVLAAVENRGTLTAYNVTVAAQLDDQASKKHMLDGTQTIKELLPGEIKVVRIEPRNTLPAVPATYLLTVQVRPLPNETIVSNNSRAYKISVAP